MPSRVLREGILSSERVCSLSWADEVFYRRLHSVVDDFGRYFAKPGLLRAACYPLQLDKVSDKDVAKWLEKLLEAALVRVYQVAGKEYLEVLDFRQDVRKRVPKFPADDGTEHATRVCADTGPGAGSRAESKRNETKRNEEELLAPSASHSTPQRGNGEDKIEEDTGDVVERIPLNDGTEFEVRKSFVDELDRLFQAVEPVQTLHEIRAWNIAKKSRRKTKRGIKAHIVSWFSREQDKHSQKAA